MQDILNELRKPFHPSHITWKPGAVKGERALAMPYADLRAYMTRLDEVCGFDWQVTYEPWGQDRIICKLTIAAVTRSSTGESTNEAEKSEIGGTVAEAQAFKRASAMFGLGRYLYNLPSGWADYDPKTRQFTPAAKAKLQGILVQHYRRATGKSEAEEGSSGGNEDLWESDNPTTAPDKRKTITSAQLTRITVLGADAYGKEYDGAKLATFISKGAVNSVDDLNSVEADRLIKALEKRIADAANGVPAK